MIYTFYSYKGGVGRSMALANVAELFYQAGLKVLMVDWDLEAPGLERFFKIENEQEFYDTLGLIDLLVNYKYQMASEIKPDENDDLDFEDPEQYLFDIYPNGISEGKLWLLSAGKRSKAEFTNYANKVKSFDWGDFYKNWEGELYIDWLSDRFREIADVILIDSRTGVTEMGGVCTYHLADVVVMFTTANLQSLAGTETMLGDFKRKELEKIRQCPLDVLVVPARVDKSYYDGLEQFKKRFIQLFSNDTPFQLGSKPDRLWKLLIPYNPKYAFEEVLAVQDKNQDYADELVDSFIQLVATLWRLSNKESQIRKSIPEIKIPTKDGESIYRLEITKDFFVVDDLPYINKKLNFLSLEDAPIRDMFLGRDRELKDLTKWVVQERCRLVSISGMGGVGKTRLSVKLAQSIDHEFDYVIWRSLISEPTAKEMLVQILKVLSAKNMDASQRSFSELVSQLIDCLCNQKCLLILDNVETILSKGEKIEQYRDGYEEYKKLFKDIAEVPHQSCLVLTSRETPLDITRQARENTPIRSLELKGFNTSDGQKFINTLTHTSFTGDDREWKELIGFYNGNPLALELVAKYIEDECSGNIAVFLREKPQFESLTELLKWHFDRLSEGEKEITIWLAINREFVLATDLATDLIDNIILRKANSTGDIINNISVRQVSSSRISTNIQSLKRRFPLEENHGLGFTLQPVIIEHITDNLISAICQECETGEINYFNKYALIKATAKDDIRKIQTRLIIKPIVNKLLAVFGSKTAVANRLKLMIVNVRERFSLPPGYAAGNILNLLVDMGIDLRSYDFSGLTICQAYLQEVKLPGVNFNQSYLDKCIFTETFCSILSVAFSPDGKYFATGDADGGIRLWQVENLQQILYLEAHSSWVRSIVFSPDGKTLASGSDDQLVKLWDINIDDPRNTSHKSRKLEGHTYRVRSVAFSPDSKILASSSFDKTVKLWDVATGECRKTLKDHTDWVWAVSFSPDKNKNKLATSSKDSTIKIWDISKDGKEAKCIRTIEETNQVLSVVFSPDGEMIAGGSDDKTVKIWDANKDVLLVSLSGHTDYVRSVAFNQDGSILASASYDNSIKLWDIKTHSQDIKNKNQIAPKDTLTGHTYRLRAIAFSSDGETLVSGGWDQTLKIWNINRGNKSLKTLQGRNNWIFTVDVSSDSKFLASGSDDQTVKLWNVETRKLEHTFGVKKRRETKDIGHTNWVWTVAFSPNGEYIASASSDETVRLWDVKTRKQLKVFTGHKDWVWTVAFSPDGEYIASGGDDQIVKLWNIASRDCVQNFGEQTVDTGWVRSVVFSPNGKILASGTDDFRVRLWDVETGELLLPPLVGHLKRVRSVAFSPNGELIASGSYDKTIRIWDVKTGNCLNVLPLDKETGHTEQVRSIAFSPDGKYLASGSNDKTAKLWNVSTGGYIRTFPGHTNEVRSVAFSKNGELFTASKDGTIRRWNIKTGEHIKDPISDEKLYEGMDISGVSGLSDLQKQSLKVLGAIEDATRS
jgi:WD40 repeat protein/cellulose biosynthesis protein BcsQ